MSSDVITQQTYQVVPALVYLHSLLTKQTWINLTGYNIIPLTLALKVIDFLHLDAFDTYRVDTHTRKHFNCFISPIRLILGVVCTGNSQ